MLYSLFVTVRITWSLAVSIKSVRSSWHIPLFWSASVSLIIRPEFNECSTTVVVWATCGSCLSVQLTV